MCVTPSVNLFRICACLHGICARRIGEANDCQSSPIASPSRFLAVASDWEAGNQPHSARKDSFVCGCGCAGGCHLLSAARQRCARHCCRVSNSAQDRKCVGLFRHLYFPDILACATGRVLSTSASLSFMGIHFGGYFAGRDYSHRLSLSPNASIFAHRLGLVCDNSVAGHWVGAGRLPSPRRPLHVRTHQLRFG